MPVLLIEGQARLGRVVRQGLALARFTTDRATDAPEAFEFIGARACDIVLLRLEGLAIDGLCLLRALRCQGSVMPLIVLDSGVDARRRIEVLDAGADDCLVEPLDVQELLARIRAATRRGLGTAVTGLAVGALRVDPLRREAHDGDRPIDLTSTELDVLLALMRSPDGFVSNVRLRRLVYAAGDARASNAIKVHLHNLRRKLTPGTIKNVRGEGYRLVAPAR